MPAVQPPTSARVFWKFKPENWRGIEYAVVAHAGIIRAVIAELVGKSVLARQNPITTWP
ncbi:hypothetical protein [Nocardia sp. NPDC059195]|uniref:hypothetical protein n=1 Tax=Nocardia sp. NPDC059195 TaxID=3346765 RepID=UPI0036B3DB8F